MISERIIELWENHEISNVRDCANLALGMIDNEDVRMYIQAMGDISKVGDSHEVWRYCKNVELMPNAQIDWGSFDERLSCVNPMRDRIFILIRLKNTPTKNVGDDKTKSFVFENLLEIVLLNVVDDRLVLQAALAVVSAHAEYVKTQQRLLEDILGAVQDIRQMNAFREARKAAEALLKEFKDPFTRVFELFPASPDTLERKALREKLTSKFSEFSSLPRSPLEVLLGPEYEGKFDLLVEDIKHPNPSTELSEKNTKIYDIVMIYYFILHLDVMKEKDLNKLLYSNNMFERYIGLIHIGVAGLSTQRVVVEYIYDNDSISDVRGAAEAVLGTMPQKITADSSSSLAPKASTSRVLTTSGFNNLLRDERTFLVQDCKQLQGDAVKDYLKNFGL
jgi:hypothetical protein